MNIISASYRTDLANYYPDKIAKSANNPDNFLVIWTKNPAHSLLNQLNPDMCYLSYTINSYGKDLEPFNIALPDRIDRFNQFADKFTTIWRYDPIGINDKYTITYHEILFEKIAERLNTNRVVISFLDQYPKIRKAIKSKGFRRPNKSEIAILCERLAKIAKKNNIEIQTCAENTSIPKGACIDGNLIAKISDRKVSNDKGYNRKHCGCLQAIDIGSYKHKCKTQCVYCYAK